MKNLLLFTIIATTAGTAGVCSQDIAITGFQEGHLTFTNAAPAAQRFLYTVDWRPNLDPAGGWSQGWSGRVEVSGAASSVTVDVPMFFRVTAYGDNLTADPNAWSILYSNAMVDASVALPSEVCHELTPITLANTNLSWRTNSDGGVEVKVVSFMSASTATNYYSPGKHNLSYGDQWVTVYPELKNFCRDFRGPDPLLRIKQLLGMPPTASGDRVVEFWVNPGFVFRPTPEPSIQSTSAGVVSSPKAPLLTPNSRVNPLWIDWYNQTYLSRNYGMTNGIYSGWPWTQLGYTYDWASTRPNHVGLSEFVIPSGTLWSRQSNAVPIEVEAILAASTYGKGE